MFNKVYGVDFPYPTVFQENGKIVKFTFSSQILKILKFIKSLT